MLLLCLMQMVPLPDEKTGAVGWLIWIVGGLLAVIGWLARMLISERDRRAKEYEILFNRVIQRDSLRESSED